MQGSLLERIGRLGQMGDVVNVKDGFARNYLLPQGKALRATEANRKRFERERAQLEARNLELKSDAEAVSGKLNGQSFIIIRQAGESGQLYGSVSTRDIATAVSEDRFLTGVSVTGPRELIEQIRTEKLKVIAWVPLTWEELERAAGSGGVIEKPAVFSDLPEPVLKFDAERLTVRLSISRRSSTVPESGAAPPGD